VYFLVIRRVTLVAVPGASDDALVVNALDKNGVLLGAEGANQLRLEQVLALRERLRLGSLQTDRVLQVAGDAAARGSSEEPEGGLCAECRGCGAEEASGCQHDVGGRGCTGVTLAVFLKSPLRLASEHGCHLAQRADSDARQLALQRGLRWGRRRGRGRERGDKGRVAALQGVCGDNLLRRCGCVIDTEGFKRCCVGWGMSEGRVWHEACCGTDSWFCFALNGGGSKAASGNL